MSKSFYHQQLAGLSVSGWPWLLVALLAGVAAINQWKTATSAKYEHTSEPFACEQKDGKTVVNSRLIGNFPSSPVDLRFFFVLEGDKIASLETIT